MFLRRWCSAISILGLGEGETLWSIAEADISKLGWEWGSASFSANLGACCGSGQAGMVAAAWGMVTLTAGFKNSLCATSSLLVSVSSVPWVLCVPVPQRGQLCSLALPKNCNIAIYSNIFSSLKSCSKKLHKMFFCHYANSVCFWVEDLFFLVL